MTVEEATHRAESARRYAKTNGLTYVPCVAKRPDGVFASTPLEAPDALRLLIRVRHVPANTIERWWTGEGLAELRLSLCTACKCNPVANEDGTCWWCEHHPYTCGTSVPASSPLPREHAPA